MRRILALVRVAKSKNSGNPKAILESLLTALYDNDVVNGKVLVSTSEGGGAASFAVPAGQTPLEFMEDVEEAIEWLEQQPDSANPRLAPRRILRLRPSFQRATI